MTLYFYKGGPRAVRSDWNCWRSQTIVINYDGGRTYLNGCDIANNVGADIPDDTYHHADPRVSQIVWGINFELGFNETAILPLEF